jgi:hypothetical protein
MARPPGNGEEVGRACTRVAAGVAAGVAFAAPGRVREAVGAAVPVGASSESPQAASAERSRVRTIVMAVSGRIERAYDSRAVGGHICASLSLYSEE